MILLVGCGNLLRRDDGAAHFLVRRIERRCRRPDVAAVTLHQLTPDLAPRLADPAVTIAIFADAGVADPAEAGRPLLQYLPAGDLPSLLGHHLGPAALLDLTARLYGRRPPAWLVTVPAEDFGFGTGLAPRTKRELRRAEGEVLSRFFFGGAPGRPVDKVPLQKDG